MSFAVPVREGNTDAVEVDAAPAFYAVATSAPFEQTISAVEDLRHSVSIPRAIRSVGAPMSINDSQAFSEAVIRIRRDNGLYQLREETVSLREQTLFDTSIAMPASPSSGAAAIIATGMATTKAASARVSSLASP